MPNEPWFAAADALGCANCAVWSQTTRIADRLGPESSDAAIMSIDRRRAEARAVFGRFIGVLRLFNIAYALLWLIMACKFLPGNLTFRYTGNVAAASLLFICLALLAALDAFIHVTGALKTGYISLRFGAVKDESPNVAAYLATYLLPFLGSPPSTLGDWLALGVYLLVAFVIFIKTDVGLVNPTIYLMGWRVFSAEIAGSGPTGEGTSPASGEQYVLAKQQSQLDAVVHVVRVAGCYLVKD